MQNNDLPSTAQKSHKNLPRVTCSPISFPQESSTLSFNIQDLKGLMRKKQKEYQNQLQIEEAERVHNLIVEIQQKKRVASEISKTNCKNSLKKEIKEYNQKAIDEFKRSWDIKKKQNRLKYDQISKLLDQEHRRQIEEKTRIIEQTKNGKNLQNIKYSKNIIELEDQLKKLVKTQRYEQAYLTRTKLQTTKNNQLKNFITFSVRKEEILLDKLKKKQQKERQQAAKRRQQLQKQQHARYLNELNQLTNNLKTYEIDLKKIQNSVRRQQRQRTTKQVLSKKSFTQKNNVQILKSQIITIINNEAQKKH